MPGDLDDTLAAQPKKIHWLATIFWGLITALCLLAATQGVGIAWLLAPLTAAYVVYLVRGGRFVLWVW